MKVRCPHCGHRFDKKSFEDHECLSAEESPSQKLASREQNPCQELDFDTDTQKDHLLERTLKGGLRKVMRFRLRKTWED